MRAYHRCISYQKTCLRSLVNGLPSPLSPAAHSATKSLGCGITESPFSFPKLPLLQECLYYTWLYTRRSSVEVVIVNAFILLNWYYLVDQLDFGPLPASPYTLIEWIQFSRNGIREKEATLSRLPFAYTSTSQKVHSRSAMIIFYDQISLKPFIT